jgi:gluconolactonase
MGTDMRLVGRGLEFPEGPIALADGRVLVVEIKTGTLATMDPDGTVSRVATVGGGPNGAALGPDGKVYVCNNGGFVWHELDGIVAPGPQPDDYIGGRIQRVDIDTGEVEDLYTEVDGNPLRAPNDLVFDHQGGMWFTDHGIRHGRSSDITGIYYAKADGSLVKEVVFPTEAPNGIGLAPDDAAVYWAETHTGRVLRRNITGPGEVEAIEPFDFVTPCLAGLHGMQLLDSLAVDSDGNVCVATLINGGVTVISPKGEIVDFVATGDIMTTNVCFGGPDLRTAYITVSSTGRLVSTPWPRPGLPLAY